MDGSSSRGSSMAARVSSSSAPHEEDSWTAVDHQELDHATSYVSESMYLVMQNPVSSLYEGESVQFKAHAQCDQSATALAGVTLTAEPNSSAAAANSQHGTLFLTNYRLLFLSFHGPLRRRHEASSEDGPLQELVGVHLTNIAELYEGRVATSSGTTMSQLEISCKNFEIVKFNFPGDLTSGELYVRITKALAEKQPPAAYAMGTDNSTLPDLTGWGVLDVHSEFARLGLQSPPNGTDMETKEADSIPSTGRAAKIRGAKSGFRVSTVNSNYKMSPTYPCLIIVPASISDGELRKMSNFRARGRVPAVTYRFKNDAVIARCAQPLVGLRRKRCAADEAYMSALRHETNGKLLFIDCRSQTSAYGNIALGGGFEVLDYYKDSNIMFMGIENIHSMRDSIRKLFDLIKYEVRGNERSNWLSCLEGTRWLEHVRSILVSCTVCVSKVADEGTSLLIHCSDGWDRTAQIVALTKLCLDPFYRTVKGFQVLIELEWCSFGHQFLARSGHTKDRANYWEDDATSPVFMQFIDAVWQLMRQFPCSFEFNERYLIALLDEVYIKRSGTFLHDCEEARMSTRTMSRCISAWTLLSTHDKPGDFLSPFYIVPLDGDGASDRSPMVLQFKWHTSSVAIWSAFYLRALESNESRVLQDAWAKELQVTQRELQDQLTDAHQKLQSQAEANTELNLELENLRKESARLQSALEGQVFSDASRGLCVHEAEDDDDGVVLSVTPVRSSRPLPIPGSSDNGRRGFSGSVCSSGASPEPSAFMSSSFEVLHSYFDGVRIGISGSSSSTISSASVSSSAAGPYSTTSLSSSPSLQTRASSMKSCGSPIPSHLPSGVPAIRVMEDYAGQ